MYARGNVAPTPAAAHARTMFIEVEATPNPDSLKFVPEESLLEDGSAGQVRVEPLAWLAAVPTSWSSPPLAQHFFSKQDARTCKLARDVLGIPHVTSVFVGGSFISVNKSEVAQWDAIRALVLHHMLEHLESGDPLFSTPPPTDAAHVITEDDDEVVAAIKDLMETRIRPAVQEDGGDIFLAGWDAATGTVKVRMAGSCVGCPSSTITLRNGVEAMLPHYVPEVQAIEAVEEGAAPQPPSPTGGVRVDFSNEGSGPIR